MCQCWGHIRKMAHHFRTPKTLFHGTSKGAWREIERSGILLDNDERPTGAICFSESRRVAEEFARFACHRHDDERGVVLELDGEKLFQEFPLSPHNSLLENEMWPISNEEEWRIPLRKIENVANFMLRSYTVWRDTSDVPAEWGHDTTFWRPK